MNIRCLPPAFLNNEYYALFSTLHFLFYLMVYPRVTSWQYIFSFLCTTEKYFTMQKYHIQPTSPIVMTFELFPIFAFTSNAAKNILAQTSFCTFANVYLGQMPRIRIAGSRENLLDIAKFCPTSTTSPPVIRENVLSVQVILRYARLRTSEFKIWVLELLEEKGHQGGYSLQELSSAHREAIQGGLMKEAGYGFKSHLSPTAENLRHTIFPSFIFLLY